MSVEILDNIPIELESKDVMKLLRQNKAMQACVDELLEAVRPIARPKAVYKVAYVDEKRGNSVHIDGVMFTSRVLRVNLDSTHRVFPYVVTCGRELDGVDIPPDDLMKSYCMETIKQTVLSLARQYLVDHLTREYALGQTSRMAPGSLEDWPLTQQKELFSLLGDVESLIGVRLTEDFLMVPIKSNSGVCFPTEVKFESCQLCPREKCPGRRVPYNPELKKRYLSTT